jgi:alpha-mannosidase
MPSGEALARQMIFGQRYFQSRFGIRSQTAWLPDSFGLSGSLPQLIRSAGMTNFFTQKLSWNNINVFPHSTFNWVGIDGTQVLCHMTPVRFSFAAISLIYIIDFSRWTRTLPKLQLVTFVGEYGTTK